MTALDTLHAAIAAADRPQAAIDAQVAEWRDTLTVEDRVALASDLWDSGDDHARTAAARLLFQARLRPDEAAWDLLQTWVTQATDQKQADLVAKSAEKRVMADLSRLPVVADWLEDASPLIRRAGLIATLALAKLDHPSEMQAQARTRIYAHLPRMMNDEDRMVRGAVAEWRTVYNRHK